MRRTKHTDLTTHPGLAALSAASIAIALLLPVCLATSARAQAEPMPARSRNAVEAGPRAGDWSAHASIGFMLGPDALLLATGAEYALTDSFGIGPLFQFGVDDNLLVFAPTLNGRFRFDLSGADAGWVRRLDPFLQFGLGLAYIDKDHRIGDDEEAGFLLNGGFGFEYRITDRFALGNNLLFNGLPTEVLDESFFFSWQFLTARYRF